MFDLSKKDDKQKVKFIMALHGKMKSDKLIFEPLQLAIERIFTPRSYKLLKDGNKESHGAATYTGTPESAKNKFVRGTVGYLVSRQPWWLRMTIADQLLMSNDDVKRWLDEWNDQLKFSFNQSTFYTGLPQCIEDGVTTGPGILLPEYNPVEHKVYYKPKSHWRTWIMDDQWGNMVVYHEELELTAVDAVKKFGEDNLSAEIKNAAAGTRGSPFKLYPFIYAIYKNPNHDPDSIANLDLPYIGYYISVSRNKKNGGLVEELGRPWTAIVLRINKKDGQTYNTHRTLAAEALTESKIDNSLGKAKLNLANKEADPPLWGPKSMENKVNRNAGAYTGYTDATKDQIGRLTEKANWFITDAENKQRKEAVEDVFFVKFFELLSQDDLPSMTAFQASLMSGEKAVLMGPITEPIEEQVLSPAVTIQTQVEVDAFLMPDAPQILLDAVGSNARPQAEFDGPLTQLRRNLLTSKGTLTGLGVMSEVIKVFPQSARKVKDLVIVEDVSIESGAKQKWFRSDEEMLELDKAAAEKEARDEQKAALLEMAKVAPGLSVPVDEESIIAKGAEALS